jgi:hypothetical protein
MSEEPFVVVNTAVYVKQFMEMNQDAESQEEITRLDSREKLFPASSKSQPA